MFFVFFTGHDTAPGAVFCVFVFHGTRYRAGLGIRRSWWTFRKLRKRSLLSENTLCYTIACRARYRSSGPGFGRILIGKASKLALRPAGRRADFQALPIRIRPKSSLGVRFPARMHFCVTMCPVDAHTCHRGPRGRSGTSGLRRNRGTSTPEGPAPDILGLILSGVGADIPPTYSLAICSNHKLAKAKAKANYDQWPLAGCPAGKAGGSVMIPGGIMVS